MNRIEEIKAFILSNWDSAEINYEELIKELKEIYKITTETECLWLISELLIHKATAGMQEAVVYTTEALSIRGDIDALHENFINASSGYVADFKNRNHHKIIDYYFVFCRLYPRYYTARKTLIDNLLGDFRIKEAEEVIDKAIGDFPEETAALTILKGELLYRKGSPVRAKRIWREVDEVFADDAKVCYGLGEVYAKFGMYDKAARYYKRCCAREGVKRMDAFIALIHIYEIQKKYRMALRYNNAIIKVFEKEYGIKSGLLIQLYLDNKEKYKNLIKRP